MRLSLVAFVGTVALVAGPVAQAASRHGSHRGGSHSSHRSHGSHRSSHHGHHSGYGFLGLGHLFSPSHHHYSLYGGSSYRYGYGYGYGYQNASYYDDAYASGDVRLLVRPARARVYVDGYYVGIVDDFDGSLQRLRLEPGAHEIALALDGFRTARFGVNTTAYQTVKLRHDMAPLGARLDDEDEPRAYQGEGGAVRPLASDNGRERSGGLRLSVSPADASVYVDGEFLGQAGALEETGLAPGSHRVEIVRPGYVSATRTVQVLPGADPELRIELRSMR